MTAPDNPSAFPFQVTNNCAQQPEFGMTLHDWFAGQALVGLASAIQGPGCADWDYYSIAAFKIADAMLAERSKP